MAEKSGVGSIKHAIIERTNSFIIIAVSITVFVVVFCGFAAKALISQSLFQQRVISEKKIALKTLEENQEIAQQLKAEYQAFATASVNVLGGNPTGDGPLDGDNPKLVLDALPSEYDYPALSSSIEKILVDGGYTIDAVGGREDDSLNVEQDSVYTVVEPIEIPYPLSFIAPPKATQDLFVTLERSIRPMSVNLINISADDTDLQTSISMSTFYQPATGLTVTTKEVK